MPSPPTPTPAHACAAALRDLEGLARDAHLPFEAVAQLYAREWAALAAQARITTFLPILTLRKVRDLVRHQGHPARVPVPV
jgi:uncharacterized protein DUF3562